MSIYVMSDIHGCFDKLNEMLSLISFSGEDELILAGDYIDRGSQSLEMLRWIAAKPANVTFLKGNHDAMFARYINRISRVTSVFPKGTDFSDMNTLTDAYYMALYSAYKSSKRFDAYGTIFDLITEKEIHLDELVRYAKMLDSFPCIAERTSDNRKYIIVHAGYTESLDNVGAYYRTLEDFYLEARTDAFENGGKSGYTIISGHTPTVVEDLPTFTDGTVFFCENPKLNCRYYDIDCGYVFREIGQYDQARIACIKLGDEKVYYC